MDILIQILESIAEKCKDNAIGAVVVLILVGLYFINEMDKRRSQEQAKA